jgi:hypothetical protein
MPERRTRHRRRGADEAATLRPRSSESNFRSLKSTEKDSSWSRDSRECNKQVISLRESLSSVLLSCKNFKMIQYSTSKMVCFRSFMILQYETLNYPKNRPLWKWSVLPFGRVLFLMLVFNIKRVCKLRKANSKTCLIWNPGYSKILILTLLFWGPF